MTGSVLDDVTDYADSDMFRLKAAWRQLVKRFGGVDAAGLVVGRDRSQISRWGSPGEAAQPTLEAIARLEREVGPVVTQELARQSRHLLIPMPPATGDPLWLNHLSHITSRTSSVVSNLSLALAGHVENGVAGTITADESRALHLRDQVREAMVHLAALDRALEAEEAQG